MFQRRRVKHAYRGRTELGDQRARVAGDQAQDPVYFDLPHNGAPARDFAGNFGCSQSRRAGADAAPALLHDFGRARKLVTNKFEVFTSKKKKKKELHV